MKDFRNLKASVRELLTFNLEDRHIEAFALYAAELMQWNTRHNLTAITDPQGIEVRHFLDSLTCLLVLDIQSGNRVVDIGSGAGFPGLPLRIVRPQIHLTIIEATGKKADFCRNIVEALHLENVEVLHARAEDIGQMAEHRGRYDWALARSVASLRVLVEYLLPFLRVGGQAIAQKGDTAYAEIHAAENALGIIGGEVDRLIPIELPGVVERRNLVVMKKIAETPAGFPRRAGIPSKKPLA